MKKEHLVIIGGSRGLGRVLAHKSLARFHQVSIIARTVGESLAQFSVDSPIQLYPADLLNTSEVSVAMKRMVEERGPLDGLAFTQRYRGDNSGEEWRIVVQSTREIIETYVDSTKGQRECSIVVMNSIAASEIADEQDFDYHITRSALKQLVRYYAVNLGSKRIRVNGITSGPYVKPESETTYRGDETLVDLHRLLSPLGRLPTAEDICQVFLFLLSDDAMFVNGQHLLVDGGISLQGHESLTRRIANILRPNGES